MYSVNPKKIRTKVPSQPGKAARLQTPTLLLILLLVWVFLKLPPI